MQYIICVWLIEVISSVYPTRARWRLCVEVKDKWDSWEGTRFPDERKLSWCYQDIKNEVWVIWLKSEFWAVHCKLLSFENKVISNTVFCSDNTSIWSEREWQTQEIISCLNIIIMIYLTYIITVISNININLNVFPCLFDVKAKKMTKIVMFVYVYNTTLEVQIWLGFSGPILLHS